MPVREGLEGGKNTLAGAAAHAGCRDFYLEGVGHEASGAWAESRKWKEPARFETGWEMGLF